jgi:hypothetical protein
MALLCVTISLGRAAVTADDALIAELLMLATGVCTAALLGVLSRRARWLAIGALVAAVPMLCLFVYGALKSAG